MLLLTAHDLRTMKMYEHYFFYKHFICAIHRQDQRKLQDIRFKN